MVQNDDLMAYIEWKSPHSLGCLPPIRNLHTKSGMLSRKQSKTNLKDENPTIKTPSNSTKQGKEQSVNRILSYGENVCTSIIDS